MKNQKQKWTNQEDKLLKNIVSNASIKDWNLISKEMNQKNFQKDISQCKYRWNNHLDPILKKDIWKKEEENRLLKLFKEIGPKWKKISDNLNGRSDNCIKNKFFSLIRKGLRYLLKFLGLSSKKFNINKIRPRILSDICEMEIEVFLSQELIDENISLGTKGNLIVSINNYIFRKFLDSSLNKKTNQFIIFEILKHIDVLNKNYISVKKNKIIKLKRINDFKFNFQNDIEIINNEKIDNLFEKDLNQNNNHYYNIENILIKNIIELLKKYSIHFSNQNEISKNNLINLYSELSHKCKEIKNNLNFFSFENLIKLRKIFKKNFFFEIDKKLKEEIQNILIKKEEKNSIFRNSFFSNKNYKKIKSKKSNSLSEDFNDQNNFNFEKNNSFSEISDNNSSNSNFISKLNKSSTNSCINLK